MALFMARRVIIGKPVKKRPLGVHINDLVRKIHLIVLIVPPRTFPFLHTHTLFFLLTTPFFLCPRYRHRRQNQSENSPNTLSDVVRLLHSIGGILMLLIRKSWPTYKAQR